MYCKVDGKVPPMLLLAMSIVLVIQTVSTSHTHGKLNLVSGNSVPVARCTYITLVPLASHWTPCHEQMLKLDSQPVFLNQRGPFELMYHVTRASRWVGVNCVSLFTFSSCLPPCSVHWTMHCKADRRSRANTRLERDAAKGMTTP
jgi:hypothetical protein